MFMVDNVSYIQGPAQPLVIIHHSHVSTTSLVFFYSDAIGVFWHYRAEREVDASGVSWR